MLVIGLVGEKLAGKDVAGTYLEKQHQAFYIKYSRIVDEILHILNLPINRPNEIALGKGLRESFNRNVLWEGMKKRIAETEAEIVVIGSIRLQDEFDAAKKMEAKTIYITAPAEVRYARSQERQEKEGESEQNFEEFMAVEKIWTEVEIPRLGKQCDFKIENLSLIHI